MVQVDILTSDGWLRGVNYQAVKPTRCARLAFRVDWFALSVEPGRSSPDAEQAALCFSRFPADRTLEPL